MYRWIPWVSQADPVRAPEQRPIHSSRRRAPGRRRDRHGQADGPRRARRRGREARGRARPGVVVHGRDVRDVSVVLAPDFGVARRRGRRRSDPASTALRRVQRDRLLGWPRPPSERTPASSASTTRGRRWWSSRPRAARARVARPHLGPEEPRRAQPDLRRLPRRAQQWFYGLVGNNQRAEPFAERGDGRPARPDGARPRSARAAARRPALDLADPAYSATCYYEMVFSRAASSSTRSGSRWGRAVLEGDARLRRGEPERDRRHEGAARGAPRRERREHCCRSSGRASRACTERARAGSGSSRPASPAPTRRSARSAWGICRNDGGSVGPPRLPRRDEPRRDGALADAPREAVALADAGRAGARSTARTATRRRGSGWRRAIGARRVNGQPAAATAGPSGGCRIAVASSRARSPTSIGPSGASISSRYASNASRSGGSIDAGMPKARPTGSVSS